MSDNPIRNVAVFGTSKAKEGDGVFELAFELGALLAQNGYTLVNGGYGGIMLASAKGAREHKGNAIGVTCEAFKRSGVNEYITEEVPTPNLQMRLRKLIELADAYVVLPGATGTLLELADIWEHKNKGFAHADNPIIIMETFWKPLLDLMAGIDAKAAKCIQTARTAAGVIELLTELET